MPALSTVASRLRHDHLLHALLLLAAALALLDPRPWSDYAYWLDAPTLAGLTGLLVLAQGVRDSGHVQRWALRLVARLHNPRILAIVMVLLSALLATVLTNDVALFLVVPLTLAIDRIADIPRQRLVIFEALAVNAGSTVSPIGNPQNLLLWQHSDLSFPAFVLALLPAGAIMLGVLLVSIWFAFSARRLELRAATEPAPATNAVLATCAIVLLVAMVAALQWDFAVPAALAVVALCAWRYPRTLAAVDWPLLLLFAAMFIGLGHLADLPRVRHLVGVFDWSDPHATYVGAIALSQAISNVPAAVLLSHYAHDLKLLAVAVNVGGSGLAIGSLANLIALRLDGSRGIGWRFHLYSIPFLLVSAVLVGWLVVR